MSKLNEMEVIGSLLRYPESIVRVDLAVDDFLDPFCASAFAGMRAMVAEGKPVDVFGLGERLGGDQALAELAQIWQECFSRPESIEFRVEKIKLASRSRKMAELLSLAQQSLQDGKDPDAVRGRLISRLSSIEDSGRRYSHTSKEIMTEVVDYLQQAFEAQSNGGLVGVTSGIDKLDEVLGGFHKSDLVIIGARPAMGKTAMISTLAKNAANAGKRVGIISAEMPAVQIGLRMVSLIGDIASTKLRACNLSPEEYDRLSSTGEMFSQMPIMLYDKPACTPSDIAMQAKAWQLSGGLDILFIDYLTRLMPDEAQNNRTREVGQMVSTLKTIAKTLDIPVVCLAQLSRKVEERADKRPMMADLRDSGEIEQEADSVMFLYRDSVYNKDADPEDAEIVIEKNRHGPCGNIKARFNGEKMSWSGAELPAHW